MADLEKTVRIVFGAVDEASQVIDSISKKTAEMMDNLGSATDPLAGAHDAVVKLESALGAMAIGGLALAVNAAGQFDSQFREITTLIGETGDSIDQFRQDILSYAAGSTQGLDDINSALYQAISLGLEYEESIKAISTAEQLAVAGKADLTSSTELLLGTLNAYGAGVDQAGRYSDAFFTIVKDGKTTIPELAQYLSQVTGTAAAAEVPVETLGAAIAAITATGAPTSQAMTQIRQVLEALIKPTKEASDYAKSLGLDFSAQSLAADGLEGVMQKVYSVTGGNVDQMARLFTSSEALKGALILSRDESGKFADALEDMENKAGATAQAFAKMAGDINLVNQNLANNVRLTLVAIGANVLDDYGNIAKSITEIFKSIQASIAAGAFDEIFDVIGNLSDDLSEVFSNMAKNLPDALGEVDFSEFAASIETLVSEVGGIFDAFFGEVDLSTPEGLAKAIQKIVDLGTRLNEVATGIVEVWQDVAEWLGKAADSAGGLDGETAKLIGNVLGLGKVMNELAGFLGGAATALEAAGNLMNVFAVKHLVGMVAGTGPATLAIQGLVAILSGPVGLAVGLAAVGAAIVKFSMGQMAEDSELASKAIEAQAAAVKKLTDQVKDLQLDGSTVEIWTAIETGDLEKAQKLIDDFVSPGYDYVAKVLTEADATEVTDYWNALSKIPEEKKTELLAAINSGDTDAIEAFFAGLDGDVATANVNVKLDESSINDLKEELVWFDENGTRHSIMVDVEDSQVEKVKKDIEEIPSQKLLEIQLQGDIDTQIAAIEAQAATAQAAFQYTAEVNIAQAQAQAQVLTAAFDAAGQSVSELAGSTSDMFGTLVGNMNDLSTSDKWGMERRFDEQQDQQKQALESQIKLNDAMIANIEAKTEAMGQEGEALIKIDSSGLEPALEMIMWQIIEKVQIRANQSSADFLLGIS